MLDLSKRSIVSQKTEKTKILSEHGLCFEKVSGKENE